MVGTAWKLYTMAEFSLFGCPGRPFEQKSYEQMNLCCDSRNTHMSGIFVGLNSTETDGFTDL